MNAVGGLEYHIPVGKEHDRGFPPLFGGICGGLPPRKYSIFRMAVRQFRASTDVEIWFSETGLVVPQPAPGYG